MTRPAGEILSYGNAGDALPADVRRNARRRGFRIVFWSILLVILLFGLTYEVLWQRHRREYFRLYDRDALLGKTPNEVTARLGPPFVSTGTPTQAAHWTYQRGMDSDAVISFRGGVVVDVELLAATKYGGKP